MDIIIIVASVATALFAAIGGTIGTKYLKLKDNFLKMLRLVNEIEKKLADGELSPEEVQELIDYYKEEIK